MGHIVNSDLRSSTPFNVRASKHGTVFLLTALFVFGIPPLTKSTVGVAEASTLPTGFTRVSQTGAGVQGGTGSSGGAMSLNADIVAFDTESSNLISGDTNGSHDVFVKHLLTGALELVSATPTGGVGDDHSFSPSVSEDGRYVAFYSEATLTGTGSSKSQVFLRDLVTDQTVLVSEGVGGLPGNGGSGNPSMSADGRFIVFDSTANDLVPNDSYDSQSGVYVWDRLDSSIRKLSLTPAGNDPDGSSLSPGISRDGSIVAFESSAPDLVSADTNGVNDIFTVPTAGGSATRVSVGAAGAQSASHSQGGVLDGDGTRVLFTSTGDDLVSGDTNGVRDLFMRDLETGTTSRVSVSTSGTEGNGSTDGGFSISEDGQTIAFSSSATNLSGTDTNFSRDVFVRDLHSGMTKMISYKGSDEVGDFWSDGPTISADGGIVAFVTGAENLVEPDANGSWGDVLLRDQRDVPTLPPWQTYGGCAAGAVAVNGAPCQGDPVNSLTGAYTTSVSDLALPGLGLPLQFSRSYTSADPTVGTLGRGWTHSYEWSLDSQSNGDVVVRAGSGQQLRFTENDDGSYTGDPGSRSSLTEVTGGHELETFSQVRFRFNSAGKLTEVIDRNDQQIELSYGTDGRLSTITDTIQRAITFEYWPTSGLLKKVLLPTSDGRSVSYGYTDGFLTSVTDVRGKTTSYTYDATGRLDKLIDQNNHTVVDNDYGPDGRVASQLDARNKRWWFDWDPTTTTSTMEDPRGGLWKDVYFNGMLVRQENPEGDVVKYSYDGDHNLLSVTDDRGNRTSMTYDERGNLLTRTAPSPHSFVEVLTYDAQNNLKTYTPPREAADTVEQTVEFDYDSAGNLKTVKEPWGAGYNVTTYGLDPDGTGLVTSVTTPRNKTWSYDYDEDLGLLTQATSPKGHKSTFGYYPSGMLEWAVDPRGNEVGVNPDSFKTAFTYNAANDLKTVTDPLGNTSTWTYDSGGNLASQVDANTHTTEYEYYDDNRLWKVKSTDFNPVVDTVYAYDDSGNLRSRTDDNLHVTTYGYDGANRLTSVELPEGELWTRFYDGAGNLDKVVNPSGNATPTNSTDGTIDFDFNELNQLTALDHSDQTPDVGFTYDANGNRKSMTDGMGTVTYAYDQVDRLWKVTRGSEQFVYGYNKDDQVTARTFPNGNTVDQTYDDDGLLETVAAGSAVTTYAYTSAGAVKTVTLPSGNGHVETRSYDRAGNLYKTIHEKGASVLSKNILTLDNVGNPLTVTDETGAVTTYKYDALDRLTHACYSTPTCPTTTGDFVTYTYDGASNRKTEKKASGTTTYSYDENDRLESLAGPSGTVTYDYDPNGNMERAGSRTYVYDMAGKMSSTTLGSTTYSYKYDGDGSRLRATWGPAADETTKFSWDVNWPLPEIALERDGSDNTLRRYVNGNELISMRVDGTTNHYYHHDALGSIANLTSGSGDSEWTYRYEPFGEKKTAVKDLATAPANLMRFAGERLDSGIGGSYHLRARQYDPSLGIFQGPDPLPAAAGEPYVSAYSYVGGRPTVLSDPSGMSSDCGGNPVGDGWYEGADMVSGYADAGTFGFVGWAQERLGINDVVNKCSQYYQTAHVVGQGSSVFTHPYLVNKAFTSTAVARMWNMHSPLARGIETTRWGRIMLHAKMSKPRTAHAMRWHWDVVRPSGEKVRRHVFQVWKIFE